MAMCAASPDVVKHLLGLYESLSSLSDTDINYCRPTDDIFIFCYKYSSKENNPQVFIYTYRGNDEIQISEDSRTQNMDRILT